MTETPVDTARPAAGPAKPIAGRFVGGSEGYFRLVWRRLRRSIIGMIGLVLVTLLLLMAVFADFFAPMDPKEAGVAFTPPDTLSFTAPDGSFSLVSPAIDQLQVFAFSSDPQLPVSKELSFPGCPTGPIDIVLEP